MAERNYKEQEHILKLVATFRAKFSKSVKEDFDLQGIAETFVDGKLYDTGQSFHNNFKNFIRYTLDYN